MSGGADGSDQGSRKGEKCNSGRYLQNVTGAVACICGQVFDFDKPFDRLTIPQALLKYNKNMEFIKEYSSMSEAARDINGDPSTISKVCKGKIKSHRNFIFKIKY